MCDKCGQKTSEHSLTYNEFPARIIGGPSGNYFIDCDVKPSEYTEFRIVGIAGGDAGPCTALVSGRGQPTQLPFDGSITLNDTAVADGLIFRISSTITPPLSPQWIRVTHSQRRVFVRIDTPANTSMYVMIQFRDKIIKTIPGPFLTVHPEDREQYHEERSRRIKLAVLGEEGELEEYGSRPGRPGRIAR